MEYGEEKSGERTLLTFNRALNLYFLPEDK